MPDGARATAKTDSTLVKALARAFRWKRMLESGEFATIAELAEREGIAPSYMTRVLRLTLLAPDVVDAILDGNAGTGGDSGTAAGAVPDRVDGTPRPLRADPLKRPFATGAAIGRSDEDFLMRARVQSFG